MSSPATLVSAVQEAIADALHAAFTGAAPFGALDPIVDADAFPRSKIFVDRQKALGDEIAKRLQKGIGMCVVLESPAFKLTGAHRKRRDTEETLVATFHMNEILRDDDATPALDVWIERVLVLHGTYVADQAAEIKSTQISIVDGRLLPDPRPGKSPTRSP